MARKRTTKARINRLLSAGNKGIEVLNKDTGEWISIKDVLSSEEYLKWVEAEQTAIQIADAEDEIWEMGTLMCVPGFRINNNEMYN